jgi:PIN domain nuclease of toxin-antitoxin system
MIAAVADTHATIWYLFGDSRLSSRAKNFIDEAATQGQQIGISSITLAEMVYLQERGRIQPTALARIFDAFDRTDSILAEVPFDRRIVQALTRVPRLEVPDFT